MIEQVAAPVQNGPNPGATAILGSLAVPRPLAEMPPAPEAYDSRLSPKPDPYHPQQVAFTKMDGWGNIVTHHNPIYYEYNPIARQGSIFMKMCMPTRCEKNIPGSFLGGVIQKLITPATKVHGRFRPIRSR